jgi:hypothetical protein
MQNGRQRYFCNKCRKYFKTISEPLQFIDLGNWAKIIEKGTQIVKGMRNKNGVYMHPPINPHYQAKPAFGWTPEPKSKPEPVKQRHIPKEWFSSIKPIKSTLKPASVPIRANPVYLWVDHKQNFHIGGTPPSTENIITFRKILSLYDPGRDMIALKRAIIKYETAHGIKNGISL